MASEIDSLVRSFFGKETFPVDVHLIGHSRGSVVVTQPAGYLNLTNGQTTVTLLDPHPAHNHLPPFFSVMPNNVGWLVALNVTFFQTLVLRSSQVG